MLALRLINWSTWYQKLCADWERPKKALRKLFARKFDVDQLHVERRGVWLLRSTGTQILCIASVTWRKEVTRHDSVIRR